MSDNDVINEAPVAEPVTPPGAPQGATQAAPQGAAPAPQQAHPQQQQQGPSPRRRLQELLAIPDSQRTDAQWDELIELEIQMAPGNRVGAGPMPGTVPGHGQRKQHHQPRPMGGGGQPGGGGGQPGGGKKPFKKFRKGPPKPKAS